MCEVHGSSTATLPSPISLVVMTGEKAERIANGRSVRRDHRLFKEEAEAEHDDEATRTKNRAKLFANHKLIKSPASTTEAAAAAARGVDFPVHECVFKGDIRKLSSSIRTHNIAQKDLHGKF